MGTLGKRNGICLFGGRDFMKGNYRFHRCSTRGRSPAIRFVEWILYWFLLPFMLCVISWFRPFRLFLLWPVGSRPTRFHWKMVSRISPGNSRPAIPLGSAAFPLFQFIRLRPLSVRKGKPRELALGSLFQRLASLFFLCCSFFWNESENVFVTSLFMYYLLVFTTQFLYWYHISPWKMYPWTIFPQAISPQVISTKWNFSNSHFLEHFPY
jgi:hypothetical protein